MVGSSDWTSHEERMWDYMPPEQEFPEEEARYGKREPEPQPFEIITASSDKSHVHRWLLLEIWHPQTQLYHPRLEQDRKTIVLVRCRICELPQTVELKGPWTIEQILQEGKNSGQ